MLSQGHAQPTPPCIRVRVSQSQISQQHSTFPKLAVLQPRVLQKQSTPLHFRVKVSQKQCRLLQIRETVSQTSLSQVGSWRSRHVQFRIGIAQTRVSQVSSLRSRHDLAFPVVRLGLKGFPFPDTAHKQLHGRLNSSSTTSSVQSVAAGENKAMETSFAEATDHRNLLDNDASIATSIPGIICPPVTTVGKSTNIVWQECMVKKEERQKLVGQKGCVIWITGLSGSGKSTLACTLDHALLTRGKLSYVLDGDNLRHGLNKNLGFTTEDRAENIRRVGEVAKLFVDAGIICIASVISPYRKDRDACRKLVKEGEFIEVHMNFPLQLCEKRDPKGLYKLARAGKIKGFTGVDDPYEAPLNCEVVMEPIEGRCPTPAEMAARLISYLEEKCFLGPSH